MALATTICYSLNNKTHTWDALMDDLDELDDLRHGSTTLLVDFDFAILVAILIDLRNQCLGLVIVIDIDIGIGILVFLLLIGFGARFGFGRFRWITLVLDRLFQALDLC
jgi:hypothetical protein